VADSTKCKIILYSVPGRCGIDIPVEVTVRLAAACPNVVSLKEAGGSVERVNQLMAAVPEGFTILSGDDSLTLPFMSVGATGVISVAGNLIPRQMSDLVNAALANDLPAARALHLKYYPLLSTLMKLDSNPVPIKAAMALAGHMQGGLRLPMIAMSPQKIEELRAVMAGLNVL
jgi:4-hydroxy-tetrahydrodipicolinate synthase